MLDNSSEESGRLRRRDPNQHHPHSYHPPHPPPNGYHHAKKSSSRFIHWTNQDGSSSNSSRKGNSTLANSNYYYRVQQAPSTIHHITTCMLLLFVAFAALIGVLEWILIQSFYDGHFRDVSSLSASPFFVLPLQQRRRRSPEDSQEMGKTEIPESMSEWEEAEWADAQKRRQDAALERERLKREENVQMDYVQDDPDKEPVLNILRQAGIDTDTELDEDTYRRLPTWSRVLELFGPKPIIYGMGYDSNDFNSMEHCEAFRNSTDPTVRFFAIAGIFNSGTNLLASLMSQNCQITERMLVYGEKSKGVRWQVPWGKHTPVRYRFDHLTKYDADVPPTNVIPLIAIRDPYQWMQSMCRHPYTVRGLYSERSCPHLVRNMSLHPSIEQQQQQDDQRRRRKRQQQQQWNRRRQHHPFWNPRQEVQVEENPTQPPFVPLGKYVNVRVKYANSILYHDSLAHFWNEWYQEYMQADFPRVFVRFEDLLFHAEQVIRTLCKCGGGVPRRPQFVHIEESAKLGTKAHGHDKTSLLQAILWYGNNQHRLDTLTTEDLTTAQRFFDPNLMNLFQYSHPALPSSSKS